MKVNVQPLYEHRAVLAAVALMQAIMFLTQYGAKYSLASAEPH